MKKISILLIFGLLLHNSNPILTYDFNADYESSHNNFEEDLFNIDTDLNAISGNLSNIDKSTLTRSPGSSADAIYTFFTIINEDPNGNPSNVLNLPIYQKTSPVRNRPILEYPFTLTYGFDLEDKNSLSFNLFINLWDQKNYTKEGTTLQTYYDLGNAERVAQLQIVDDLLGLNIAENLAKSLGLFDPATIQERRLGGILESHVLHNKWNLMMQLPILYTEQNLSLKPWEKAAITMSPIGSMLRTDGVDENDFIYDHIVMDQFGFGDLKFKTMYQMHNTNTFNLDLGGFVILPTARALKQGIIGTWFDQNNERAYLDLTSIDPENITVQNQDDIANFFLGSVNKLSSNILNSPLGNGGFVVIAPSMNFDWYFARNWQFSNDFSLQIPLPTVQPRFFQKTQSQVDFLIDYNAAYDAGPTAFATFVNQELQNLFFPYVFPTQVFPGLVFNSTNQFMYTFSDFNFYIGGNYWYQGSETLQKPSLPFQQSFEYDYIGAQAASAAQAKLLGKINYNTETTNYSWSLSLYGDITIWNSGIGNDFTLAVNVDCKF
ncbi:hypothetical protein KBC04_04235 [Candidatus Babeliales bacterium]|nr:hypothetical protein [Candidatus Babeliales bacterium]MBP9844274.1 hypothetical protein [Candidatus Babeliales bacterium]